MAVDLSEPPIIPYKPPPVARPASAAVPPDDPVGARFLASAPWALLAAAAGAWLGSLVNSAVESSAASRVGALFVAPLLAVCGAAVGFAGSRRYGFREAAGRALMDAATLAWQGAWLGALIAGGFAATGGGTWVIIVALSAVALGALAGLGVGLRLFKKELPKTLKGVVWGGVIGGFAASFLWAPPIAAVSSADAIVASPAFGPSADWIWRTAGAAPLVLAALVWWIRWMREDRRKETERAGWGMGIAALLFIAAIATGLGAIVGGLAQLGIGYFVYQVNLTPTLGTWLGAIVALFFWGAKNRCITSPARERRI